MDVWTFLSQYPVNAGHPTQSYSNITIYCCNRMSMNKNAFINLSKTFYFLTTYLVLGEFSVHHSWDLASESNPECLGTIIGRLLVS